MSTNQIVLPFILPSGWETTIKSQCPLCGAPLDFIAIKQGGFGFTMDGFIFVPQPVDGPLIARPSINLGFGLRKCGIRMLKCVGTSPCGPFKWPVADDPYSLEVQSIGKEVLHSFWTWEPL